MAAKLKLVQRAPFNAQSAIADLRAERIAVHVRAHDAIHARMIAADLYLLQARAIAIPAAGNRIDYPLQSARHVLYARASERLDMPEQEREGGLWERIVERVKGFFKWH